MAHIITSQTETTAEWFSAVLREGGRLLTGSVTDLRYRSNDAFNSSVGHYELTYSADAPPDAPRSVLLKLNGDTDGENEVGVYQLALAQPEYLPMLVPCYMAEYDPTRGNSYLLLEDLSATHANPVTREKLMAGEGVAPEPVLHQIIEALAEFHAFWWQHPKLGQGDNVTEVRWYKDKLHFDQHVERRRRNFSQYKTAVGSEVPAMWLELYEEVLGKLPSLWQSYFEGRVLPFKNITLTCGDAYATQFLCPKEGVDNHTYLIDFQDAGANFGPFDLAYLMAAFWTPAQRHEGQREEKLLRRYLAVLEANGVQNYTWDDLLTDYRLMVIIVMLIPVWDQTTGAAKSYWWPKTECLIAAFEDLNCWELLNKRSNDG